MSKVMAFIKLHWPTILALGTALWVNFGPRLAEWVTAHPRYSVVFATISFIIGYYKQSPIVKKAN